MHPIESQVKYESETVLETDADILEQNHDFLFKKYLQARKENKKQMATSNYSFQCIEAFMKMPSANITL